MLKKSKQVGLCDSYKTEIRRRPIYFWAFACAFISCAFIACFLTLAQLVMYDFPKWADYGITVAALAFTYMSLKQGINFYRIKKGALYYFLAIHCAATLALIGLMIKDGERLYLVLVLVLFVIVVLHYKLIGIVKEYYRLTGKEDS